MIDWTRVNQLREEIGQDDFDEIVEIFLEEVEEEISSLRNDPAPNTLEAKLHFLKGSALNLGFAAFSDLCKSGESAAAQGQTDEIDVASIVSSYDASKSEFLDALSSA